MKNLLKIVVVLSLMFTNSTGYGQIGTGLENSLGLNVGNLRNGMGVQSFNKKKGAVDIKGSSLLLENNCTGKIGFKNSKVSREVTLNYDLLTGVTIVYTADENYYIEPHYVDSIFIVNPIFNTQIKYVKTLNKDGKEVIMEILSEGEIMLLKEFSAKLLKPTYNMALDTGSKDYRVKRKHAYYVYYDDKLAELPKKASNIFKKKILPRKFKKHISSKKYSLKDEEALIEVFVSLNESI